MYKDPMSTSDTDYCRMPAKKTVSAIRYVTVTPIYQRDKGNNHYGGAVVPPSTRPETYVEPIGRKELATTWWKHCPNQCMAHLPSRKPCIEYCKSLRKHVSILSKHMITTEYYSNMEWNDDSDNDSRDSRRTLVLHPRAIQKQQSNLIHVIPINKSGRNNSAACCLSSSSTVYNVRIGNDLANPWMQFNVSILYQAKTIPMPRSTVVKRTLDFDSSNISYFPQTKRNRSDTTDIPCNDVETNARTDSRECDVKNRNLSLSKEPSEMICPTEKDHACAWAVQTQEFISHQPCDAVDCRKHRPTKQCTKTKTAATTPHHASKIAARVTPETTSSQRREDETIKYISSQRQLFPGKESIQISQVKHCRKKLFLENLAEINCDRKARQANSLDETKASCNEISKCGSQSAIPQKRFSASSYESNDDNSDEEYATYLSLPLPENSPVQASPRNCGNELSTVKPVQEWTQQVTYYSIANSQAIESYLQGKRECRKVTKVVDLSLQEWKHISNCTRRRITKSKPTLQFHQAMADLVLLRNQIHNSASKKSDEQLWLPPIVTTDTVMSCAWTDT
jgi:hypothetical protein